MRSQILWEEENQESLYFSTLFGNGIYHLMKFCIQDPYQNSWNSEKICPIFENVKTKERFFARLVLWGDQRISTYQHMIIHAPNKAMILWPSDLIEWDPKRNDLRFASVEIRYDGLEQDTPNRYTKYALLFPYSEELSLYPIQPLMDRYRDNGWQSEYIRHMCVKIVTAFACLNKSNYIYLDFKPHRFLINEDKSMVFDFTQLVFQRNVEMKQRMYQKVRLPQRAYPMEFMEPSLWKEEKEFADESSQNYSLAAYLFYLCFGRYACQGKLLDGFRDESLATHLEMFRYYFNMPIFIFDPVDHSNHLGEFKIEQRIIDSWNAIPEDIKELFCQALCQGSDQIPRPQQWMEVLKRSGWEENDEAYS